MWTYQVYGHHDKMARTKTHRTSQNTEYTKTQQPLRNNYFLCFSDFSGVFYWLLIVLRFAFTHVGLLFPHTICVRNKSPKKIPEIRCLFQMYKITCTEKHNLYVVQSDTWRSIYQFFWHGLCKRTQYVLMFLDMNIVLLLCLVVLLCFLLPC